MSDENIVSHDREGLMVWLLSFAVLVLSTILYLIYLWMVYVRTPKLKRWTLTFWIAVIILFIAAVNTFITIRQETRLLLKTDNLEFKLWEYTIPHFITLFGERTLGEFALVRYLYILFYPKRRLRVFVPALFAFLRAVSQLIAFGFGTISLNGIDKTKFLKEIIWITTINGVLLSVNSFLFSGLFLSYYVEKLKYARSHRKFLKSLKRVVINHALIPCLLVCPLLVLMIQRKFVEGNLVKSKFGSGEFWFAVIFQFFRLSMNLSVAYSMFLLNLGPRYLRFGKLYNNRSIRKDEDVPHELHKKHDPVSILEQYGREVYLRLGIVGGLIVKYQSSGCFTPCCKFTTDIKTESVNVLLDANDCPLPSKLVLEHALANDVAVVRNFDDFATEDLNTVLESAEFNEPEENRNVTRSIICVPLIIRQKQILLYAESTKDEFVDVISSSDIFILELLTQQLLVSLENASLFEDLARMNQELDRKVAERTKELEVARAKAEEYAKSKSAFLANMSHEVRTPASQIIGAAELLSDTQVNSEQNDYIRIIIKSGKLLLNILNDILDLSKLDSNKLVLEHSEFDLYQTVQLSVEAFTIGKPLQLCYFMDDYLPRVVVGDAMRLQQIFTNLLSNSIKFTERGHIVLYTHSELISSSDVLDVYDVTFSVTDTGSGISPDRLQNIFDRFEQENMSISRLHGGTGLGLSISQDLCGLMGSKLHADSTVGVGSTFYFTIRFKSPKEGRASRIIKSQNIGRALILAERTSLEFRHTHKTVLQLQLESFEISVTTEHLALNTLPTYVTDESNHDVIFLDLSTVSPETTSVYVEQLESLPMSVPVILINFQHAVDIKYKPSSQYVHFLNLPYKQSSLHQIFNAVKRQSPPTPRSSIPDDLTASTISTSSSPYNSTSFPHLKIMLAEDNIVNQKVLQAMFKRIGYKIDIAANGVEAVELSKKIHYDAIFMDVRMPLKDGLEATKEILSFYETERKGRKPIIIGLSADALVENQEVGLKAGMSAYLAKPVSKETLINVLQELF